MTNPKHAYELDDRGRYYRHPTTGEALVSVTNVLSLLAKFGLPRWYAASAAEYAMENLPALVQRSRTDYDGALRDIKDEAERRRDSAADLGTRVHALAEAHLLGTTIAEDPDLDPEAGIYVDQYLRFLDDFGIDLERDVYAAEMTVADPKRGYAGTLDAIVRLGLDGFLPYQPVKPEKGERALWMYDIKTSRTRSKNQCFESNALQLTALKHAKEMWLPDDTVKPMVKGITGAAVLNLRQRDYALIPLPTGTPEIRVFHHLLAVKKWLDDEWPGDYGYRPMNSDGTFIPKRGTSNTKTSPAERPAPATIEGAA